MPIDPNLDVQIDPSLIPERPKYYTPSQAPLASPKTVQPGVQFGQMTEQRVYRLHLWNCWWRFLTVKGRFGITGFVVFLFGVLQLLCHRWGRASLMALYAFLLLATPYYIGRLHIQHRFARFVRKLFFITFTYPGDMRPPRLLPRIFPILVIVGSSIILLFWP